MGLAETQALLARLYTEAPLRARFLADPESVGLAHGVAFEEAQQLPGPQIEQFARALIHKRRQALEKLLPGTVKALGPSKFATLFRRHSETYVPRGTARHRCDALAFLKSLNPEAVGAPWIADLARFETARLSASETARRWVVCLAHRPVAQFSEGGPPTGPPTLYLWVRPRRLGTLVFMAIPLPLPSREKSQT